VRKPGVTKTRKKSEKGVQIPKQKTNQTGVKQQLTFNLLPLRLEVTALSLDHQLEALDGLTLLLEGQLLICVCNAEHNHLALGLGERGVPLLQRLLRRLASDALLLQRRPGVGEGGLLLLEPPLSPLAGGATLASRAAFKSSASLARCSSPRARFSAWRCRA
jgi:hypothetical protein